MKSILNKDSNKVLVQGLGRDGSFQTQKCIDYGTQVVAVSYTHLTLPTSHWV